MKRITISHLGTVLVLALVLTLSAVVAARETESEPALMIAADVLMGSSVVNDAGGEVARVENLLIDPTSGTIELVTLSLRDSNRVVGVPWSYVRVVEDGLRLAVTTQELERAPEFQEEPSGEARVSAPAASTSESEASESRRLSHAPGSDVTYTPGARRSYDAVVVGKVVADVAGDSERDVVLIIDLGDREARAHVGPAWYLEKAGVSLEPGTALTITGSADPDVETVIVASELSVGGKTVLIRNTDGTPVWPAYR